MKDKVAIPIWNRRISPVMDTASQLLIFKIDDKQQEVSKEIVPIKYVGSDRIFFESWNNNFDLWSYFTPF